MEISELHIKISDHDPSSERGRRVAEITVLFSDGTLGRVKTFPPNQAITSDSLLESVKSFVNALKPESQVK